MKKTPVVDFPKIISLPKIMDPRGNLSFFENKNQIPDELKTNLNYAIFGCDICQDVCPWNKFSKPHNEKKFIPNDELSSLKKSDWIELTEETFNRIFEGSAVKRSKYQGIIRNIKASN